MPSRLFAVSLFLTLFANPPLSHADDPTDGELTSLTATQRGCDTADLADCCEDGCEDCGGENCDSGPRFLGVLPSDHCFDCFISPLSNPFFFEDPRSLSEVRGTYITNSLPTNLLGGDVEVWSTQFRARLTDRLSFIAPRVAYMEINNQGAGDPDGTASAPIGLKYNLVRDVGNQLLASAGITYFIPGSEAVFQGFGDGDFHLFVSGGKEIFGGAHWLSGAGFRLPVDNNFGTQLFYWSNQWDYELPAHFYAVAGVNWFHCLRGADGFGADVTGLDLVNLPAGGVGGQDVVSGVIGAKWKPSGQLELGAGYEFPMTGQEDILRNRFYADVIVRF